MCSACTKDLLQSVDTVEYSHLTLLQSLKLRNVRVYLIRLRVNDLSLMFCMSRHLSKIVFLPHRWKVRCSPAPSCYWCLTPRNGRRLVSPCSNASWWRPRLVTYSRAVGTGKT